MTVYTALNAVREVTAFVIDTMPDVSTHWADCHRVHAACLAHLLRDLIEEEMKA